MGSDLAGWGRPLQLRALEAVGAGPGTELLDVGCGAGRLLRLAADRGALVTGVDADPAQLALAAALVPSARLHSAEVHALPIPYGVATAVTCLQVLMHVPNPLAGLREIARVAAPGAAVALTVWGPPEQCAFGVFGAALESLLGGTTRPDAAPRPGPPPLSAEGRLAKLATLAELVVHEDCDVGCPFDFPSDRAVLDSVVASELGRRAVARVGAKLVRRAVLAGLAPHRLPGGGYRLENTFRLVLAHARTGCE